MALAGTMCWGEFTVKGWPQFPTLELVTELLLRLLA